MLDNDVAAQDAVADPVNDTLESGFHHGRRAIFPRPAGIIEDLGHGDISDVTSPEARDKFPEDRAGAALEIHPKAQIPALRFLAGSEKAPAARNVNRHGSWRRRHAFRHPRRRRRGQGGNKAGFR